MLFRWLKFLAGQFRERAALRWLAAHREEIIFWWFGTALILSIALGVASHGATRGSPSLLILLHALLWGHSWVWLPFSLGLLFGISAAIAVPVLVVVFPLLFVASPLIGLALGATVIMLFVTMLFAFMPAPFSLLFGARGLFLSLFRPMAGGRR